MHKTLLMAALLLGCSANRAAAPAPATSATQETCTLDTPLQEGIPGSPGHPIPSDVNPNGMSQLAVLMRTMLQDMQQARAAVEADQPVAPMWTRHKEMRCSWPTKPQDRNAQFEGFAVAYLAALKGLEDAPQDRRASFNATVRGCLACHGQACPGPVEIIEPLLLP